MIQKKAMRSVILTVIFFALGAGITYAANKVVVIPLDTSSAASGTEVAALMTRIEALEQKLACIDPTSDAQELLFKGCDVLIEP